MIKIEDCRKQEYAHNARTRYTDGFKCDDCGTWIGKETEEYLRTEGLSNYSMGIHNIGVYFRRAEVDIPQDYITLSEVIKGMVSLDAYSIPIVDLEKMVKVYEALKVKYRNVIILGQNL